MNKALFDSNILIDALNDIEAAREEMAHHQNAAISAITWMEVAVRMTAAEKAAFSEFLKNFPIEVIHTNEHIMDAATTIRGNSLVKPPAIKLMDAIIGATALVCDRLLITRNPRDFGTTKVRVPYRLQGGAVSDVLPPPAA